MFSEISKRRDLVQIPVSQRSLKKKMISSVAAFIGNKKLSFASSKGVQAVVSKLNLKRQLEVRKSKAGS